MVNAIAIVAKQYVQHLRRRTRRSCVHVIDVEDLYGRQTTYGVSGLALWTVVERRDTLETIQSHAERDNGGNVNVGLVMKAHILPLISG